MTDFDWNSGDSIVIERVSALAVYLNPEGDVVIRQQIGAEMDADEFVAFPVCHIDAVIAGLHRIKKP